MKRFVKKAVSLALVMILVCGLVQVGGGGAPALAGDEGSGGYGSNGKFLAEIDPPAADSIPISTRAELEAIKDNLSGKYHLVNDIDLAGEEWVPIGNSNTEIFTGVFDGQGFLIKNLTITGNSYTYNGLFGRATGATLKNIGLVDTLIDVSYTSNLYIGGLVAVVIIDSATKAPIINCFSTGKISSNASATSSVGGIVGRINNNFSPPSDRSTPIKHCYNAAQIISADKTSGYNSAYTGGIVGMHYGFELNIDGCLNMAAISAESYMAYAGGIIGYMNGQVQILNCHNTKTGDIISESTDYANAGGILGGTASYRKGATIINCSNAAPVSSLALGTKPMSAMAGGIFSSTSITEGTNISIDNCFNLGDIFSYISSESPSYAASYAGGITGEISGDSGSIALRNCYSTGRIDSFALAPSYLSTSGYYSPAYSGAGGLVGRLYMGTYNRMDIQSCYFVGEISSSSSNSSQNYEGGILGFFVVQDNNIYISSLIFQNCYYPDRILVAFSEPYEGAGRDIDNNITALSDVQMRQQSSYVGFDFDTIWKMPENGGYPIFQWQDDVGGDDDGDDEPSDIEPVSITFRSLKEIGDKDIIYNGWWGSSFFKNDSYYSYDDYNHSLAKTLLALSGAAYGNGSQDDSYIKTALGDGGLDLDDIQTYNYDYTTAKDGIGYAIANKKMAVNGKTHELIVIVIRGTAGEEWYGDFNIGSGETHASFEIAKNKVLESLMEYINTHALGHDTAFSAGSWDITLNPFKFVITGHSRGAAVANLLAAELIDDSSAMEANKIAGINANPYIEYLVGEEAVAAAIESINTGVLFPPDGIYCYTFATPNVTTNSRAKIQSLYKGVFNLVNAEDFVTFMPLPVSGWNYWKYGTTLAFPSGGMDGLNPSFTTIEIRNMRSIFESMTGVEFEYYKDGYNATQNFVRCVREAAPTTSTYYSNKYTAFQYSLADYFKIVCDELVNPGLVNEAILAAFLAVPKINSINGFLIKNSTFTSRIIYAHAPETYLAWLQATSESNLLGRGETPAVVARIACPVDVEVYNNSNTLVGKTVNNVPDESLYGEVSIYTSGDVKYVYMPAYGSYTIQITATDSGTMEYLVERHDVLSGQTNASKAYSDISLTSGKLMQSVINDTVEISDIQLFVLDDQGNPIAEVLTNGTEVAYYATISPRVTKIVEGCAANIPVESNADSVILYAPDGSVAAEAVVPDSGQVSLRITSAYQGSYVLKAVKYGLEMSPITLPCVAMPDRIWEPEAVSLGENAWKIIFASHITLINNAKMTVNGVAVKAPTVEDDGLSIIVPQAKASDIISISGIKYADLFPSYSFTFTVKLSD